MLREVDKASHMNIQTKQDPHFFSDPTQVPTFNNNSCESKQNKENQSFGGSVYSSKAVGLGSSTGLPMGQVEIQKP